VSPRGEVPALVEGEVGILVDSTMILEYIEDRWPKPALLPATPEDRARVRMLEDVMDTQYARAASDSNRPAAWPSGWLAPMPVPAWPRPPRRRRPRSPGCRTSPGSSSRGLMKREYRDHRLEWMIRSGGLQVVLDGLRAQNIRFNREFE
jgi:hypothetical protein